MLDYDEAWNNAHDPQRREPVGYCIWCGGEIYSEEALVEYEGFCEYCYTEMERALLDDEEGIGDDAWKGTDVPL